ncbi:putative CsbD-like domain-containing protein [Seiridium cardinale]
MSNIGNDIKSGLKGIHGVGEALRGSVNEAADQALDTNTKHPAAQMPPAPDDVPSTCAKKEWLTPGAGQESQLKNRGVAEKGKADIAGADNMIARHEVKHQGTGAPVQSQPVEGNHAFTGGATGTSGTTGTY